MPKMACRLRVKLVISNDFYIVGNCFYYILILSKKCFYYFTWLIFTELLVLLHNVGLNVGNQNNLSMMNLYSNLLVLVMDPDWGSFLVVFAIFLWVHYGYYYWIVVSYFCLYCGVWAWQWVVVLQCLRLLLIYLLLWLMQSHDFGNWLVYWYCSLEIGWYGVWYCSLMMVYTLPMLYWFSCGCDLAELQCCPQWCLSIYFGLVQDQNDLSLFLFALLLLYWLKSFAYAVLFDSAKNLNQMNLEQVSKFKYGS